MPCWTITCPQCEHRGSEDDFRMSLCDECFCPGCGCEFLLEYEADEGDEED